MPSRSIIFCGTPEFACPSLQVLHDDPAFEVKLVITQPDKPAGRGKTITSPPVKVLAESLGLPVLQPKDINEENWVRHAEEAGTLLRDAPSPSSGAPQDDVPAISKRPDFLVVVAYGQILSEKLLQYPKIAPVNLHASLLPHLRGASPIQNSILGCDRETGVTVQRMAPKVDEGPILSQEKISIDPRETKDSLTEKLAHLGAELLIKTLKEPLKETKQDESKATHCKKLTRTVGRVDPEGMTAKEIDRHVRALVPWPGVRMTFSSSEPRALRRGSALAPSRGESRSHDVKLIETSLEPNADALALSCKEDSTLYVLKIQSPGKNVVTGAEWGRNKKR